MKKTHKVKERYKKKLTTLGKNIKKLREARGFTQEYIAFNSDIAFSTLNSIENGHVNPTIGTLYAIADTLKVSLSELVD